MSEIHTRIKQAAPHNAEILQVLSDTDYAPPELSQTSIYLTNLRSELRITTAELMRLTAITHAELRDHEKYRDSTIKRFAYKLGGRKGEAKFAAKASKEEKEYFEAWQAESAAKTRKNALERQIEEADARRAELEVVVGQHSEAQKMLDELYASIFAGPTPDFPEEDQKEVPVAQAQKEHDDVLQRLQAENQVVSVLDEADASLKAALKDIAEALQWSTHDLVGGGAVADIQERDALSRAQGHASECVQLVEQARALQPEVEGIGDLKVAKGSIVGDLIFDNVLTDASFHEKIRDSEGELRAVARRLLGIMVRAKERRSIVESEKAGKEVALREARRELQRVRQEAFEKVTAPAASCGRIS